MLLRFAYVHLFYILIPIFIVIFLYRWWLYKSPVYTYPLAQLLIKDKVIKARSYKTILFLLRACTLLGLMFLIARPQWVDESSKVHVEGVDIVLTIDVSGSMQLFDDPHDQRMRIDVAKAEAIRFIEKRIDDPIGVVLFGGAAITRCPLTLDKTILKEVVGNIVLGDLDPQGTFLGTGIALAVNRLKNSKAKSKIIILLTDGEPSPGEKVDPDVAADMAHQFGIKIYTIGIGGEQGGFTRHPLFGMQQVPQALNVTLLQKIADKTGGKFFRARNPKEMQNVYKTIDALEKTEYQTNIFHRYYEAFLTFIWIVVALLALEFVLRGFLWRGV